MVMATSTFITKNLTKVQIEFMLTLEEQELDIFSIDEVKDRFSDSFKDINEIVENLVHKGIFIRLEKGKYCRSNFNDENVIGSFIAQNGAISYWSALNKHGLTDQFPNVQFIQTTQRKRDKLVLGVHYKFVQVLPRKCTEIITQGYGNRQYRITDIEKTIADCFDLPKYSGGYAELIKAFSQARLSGDKMTGYCMAINNIAVTKRMGFLAELLNKIGMKGFVKFARQSINPKYNIFDPFGTDTGEFVNDWRLRLNISRDEILNICNNQY
jgi:predicted transcriptional regulator of viral defense system